MINGVIVKQPDAHIDYRGELWTIWKDTDSEWGNLSFNHDKVSISRKHVLRGIHGDDKSCIKFAEEIHEKFGLDAHAPKLADIISV